MNNTDSIVVTDDRHFSQIFSDIHGLNGGCEMTSAALCDPLRGTTGGVQFQPMDAQGAVVTYCE